MASAVVVRVVVVSVVMLPWRVPREVSNEFPRRACAPSAGPTRNIVLKIIPIAVALLAGSAFSPVHRAPDGGHMIIRHDRPDARYLALGSRHPAVVRVGTRLGDGTLVGDRWVLTAAHVARGLMSRPGEKVVFVGERRVSVRRAFLHPKWVDMAPQDIALLELDAPVAGVVPIAFYEGRNERGQTAILVGHGRTGTGQTRERRDDDLKRGVTNRVEEASAEQLVFQFDAPPGGTDLEGIPGAGDSGGPALLEAGGRMFVAGVSSAGQPGRDGPGSYGAMDYFTRVSSHLEWLRAVMAGTVAPTDLAPNRSDAGSVDIPESPAGRRLRALVSLFESGDSTRIATFVQEHVRPAEGQQASGQGVQSRYRRLLAEHRDLTITQVLLREPYHVDLLVKTKDGERILGVQVEPRADGLITGVLTGRP